MKNLLLAAAIGFGAMGCTDRATENPDVLPEATQVGANTAGCIINGKIIIPKDGINSIPGGGSVTKGLEFGVGPNFYSPVLGSDRLSLQLANLKDRGQSYWIYLYINSLKNGVGEYTIDQGYNDITPAPSHSYIFVRETNNGVSGKTYLSSDNSGIIVISKLTGTICSGTFSGTLYNKDNPSEKIQVTEGRFDFRIK